MFDFSGSELLVIAIVALVVIGPKDLPKVLRAAGKWAAKARAVAREFQSSIDEMIRESELADVKKEMESVAATDVGHEIERSIDPKGELTASMQPPDLTQPVSNPAGTAETTGPSAGEVVTQQPDSAALAEDAKPLEPAPSPPPTEAKPEKAA